MGRGQRHSKNAGGMGAENMTYAERKALGFGTVKERLGKVSQGMALVPAVHECTGLGSLCTHKPIAHSMSSEGRDCPRTRSCVCCMQDSLGNYSDCCLTLTTAMVSTNSGHQPLTK